MSLTAYSTLILLSLPLQAGLGAAARDCRPTAEGSDEILCNRIPTAANEAVISVNALLRSAKLMSYQFFNVTVLSDLFLT